jgi:hypothetical protein
MFYLVALLIFATSITPAYAGGFGFGDGTGGKVVEGAQNVRVYGSDTSSVATISNPVPVALQGTGTISGNVGVKGVDGATVHSGSNPLAVAPYLGGIVNSASNPTFSAPDGVPTASITNTNSSILAVSTLVTLTAASRHVTIKTSPTAAIIYVDYTGGAASSADWPIYPGGSYTIDLGEPITGYRYIGVTGTGDISTCAH